MKPYRWFAWHPVTTQDQGLVWWRWVWREVRVSPPGPYGFWEYWYEHWVDTPIETR